MQKAQSKITSHGQVSVPGSVRNFLLVERATRHSTQEVHAALFPENPPNPGPAKTLVELKQGIRQQMRRRHAGG
jgi:hypothetical protein